MCAGQHRGIAATLPAVAESLQEATAFSRRGCSEEAREALMMLLALLATHHRLGVNSASHAVGSRCHRRTCWSLRRAAVVALCAGWIAVLGGPAGLQATVALASGTDYYVDSVNGSDANSGTSPTAPWQTMAAVNGRTFGAGDTINLARGASWTGGGAGTGTITINGAGSSGSPITVQAYGTGNAPVISNPAPLAAAANAAYGMRIVASYVVVQNLLFSSFGEAGIVIYGNHALIQDNELTGGGAGLEARSQYDLITNNYFHDMHLAADDGQGSSWGGDGIMLNGTSNDEISYNRFVNCIAPSGSQNSVTDGSAVEFYSAVTNVAIDHNDLYNDNQVSELGSNGTTTDSNDLWADNLIVNSSAWGVHLGGSFTTNANGLQIINNTFIVSRPTNINYNPNFIYTDGGNTVGFTAGDLVVRNNIFYASGFSMGIDQDPDVPYTHDHNLYYGIADWNIALGATEKAADPEFADFAGGDYELEAGSPAIGAGLAPAPYPTDYAGNPVPSANGVDIGAYEYYSNQQSPTPTGTLQATSGPTSTADTRQHGLDQPHLDSDAGANGHADADGDPDAHSHADGDPRADANAHADRDPHAHLDAHAYSAAHVDAHGDPAAHVDAHGDPDAHGHADGDPHADANAHADRDPHAHLDAHAYSAAHVDAHGDPDAHGHADGDPRADANAHAGRDPHAHLDAHAYSAAHVGAHGDPDAHGHAGADVDGDAHGHPGSHVDGDPRADANAHADRDPHAHLDAHAYSAVYVDAHGDPDSHSHADADVDGDAHGHPGGHVDADVHADARADSDAHGHPGSYADADVDGNARADSDAHGHPGSHAYADVDGDAHSHPGSYADADVHADARADSDAHGHRGSRADADVGGDARADSDAHGHPGSHVDADVHADARADSDAHGHPGSHADADVHADARARLRRPPATQAAASTPTFTLTPAPTQTPTATPAATPVPTPTQTPTAAQAATPVPTPTQTSAPMPTPPPANLLTNGGFESGTSPWFLNVRGDGAGTFSIDSTNSAPGGGANSAKIVITAADPNHTPNVQLGQSSLAMTGGQPYQLSFWAMAAAGRPIGVAIQGENSPWTTYWSTITSVTTSWVQYGYTFTPSASDTTTWSSI